MLRRKILVVDDDAKVVDVLKLYLNHDGYDVIPAYYGNEALKLARENRPDLIVLDLMLPGIDGLKLCRILRNECDTPIIMLTAKTTEQDKIAGLDLGADDYIPKPFSPKELVARVRAVLRRTLELSFERGPNEIKQGEIKIDYLKHEASKAGEPLDLTPTEFKLLGIMAKSPERVFSRSELIELVLGYDFEGLEHTMIPIL